MNQNQMTARVGLFFLIGIALVWITYEALHDGQFSGNRGYTLTASFASLKELKAGDPVRMAGVQVGTVESTRLNRGKAEAVLRIQPDVEIASDTTATIAMAGLLGSNYISLTLGDPAKGRIPEGTALATVESADLNQILNDLGALGKDLRGTLAQVSGAVNGTPDGSKDGLLQKLDRLVSDNGSKLTNTVDNLENITNQIRSGQGTVGKLIYDQEAYNRLLATVDEIKGAATDARTFLGSGQQIFADVRSGKGAVGALFYDETVSANLRTTMQNLRDVSDKLNNPNSTFGQLIGNDQLIRDVQGTLRKADRALDGLSDQGPITAVGTVAQGLF